MSGTNGGNLSAFGRLLRSYRLRGTEEEGSLSRPRLSTLLGGAFSPSTIEKYERGERRPSPYFIVSVARALALTEDQEAALVQAAGVDMTDAYLAEYREVSADTGARREVPDDVKRDLSAALVPTHTFQVRLGELGDPDFVALGATGDVGARNRGAQARATMLHVALIVQVARYHIHLARYERVRHRHYITPANPAGGDVAAAFLFTSFATHAITIERYLTIALALQFGIVNHLGTGPNGRAGEVRRSLLDNGHAPFAALLGPFQHDHHWQWLRRYRDRWEHRDPLRIAELGMQFSNKRDYWQEEPTTLPSGEPGRALELTVGAGDPAETTVEEMLEKGVYCFNLLAKQVDAYIGLLEAG